MRQLVFSVCVTSAMAMATLSALAQQPATAPDAADIILHSQTGRQELARVVFLGQKVLGSTGEIVGEIEDIVLEGDKVRGVILAVGGFLGVGEKRIGVSYGALKLETREGKPVLVLPLATKKMLTEVAPFAYRTPQKTILQQAGEAAKAAAQKASEAAKVGYEKAKEAVEKATTPAAGELKQ